MLQQVYISGHELKDFSAFGINLYPLTLGHIQLLAEMECSLPFPPQKIEVADVYKLVAVAAYPDHEQAREDLPKRLNDLVSRIAHFTNDENRAGIVAATDYLTYYMAKPRTMGGAVDYLDTRVPWWWGHAEFMQSEMGRSERDAWKTLVVDAFAYFACWSVRHGDSETYLDARGVEIEKMVKAGKTPDQIIREANG